MNRKAAAAAIACTTGIVLAVLGVILLCVWMGPQGIALSGMIICGGVIIVATTKSFYDHFKYRL